MSIRTKLLVSYIAMIVVPAILFAGAAILLYQLFFNGMPGPTHDWSMHRTFVAYFDKLAILMFVLSFFGKIRGRLRWFSLGLFAMTTLQYITVTVLSGVWVLAALHTVDALVLFWGALFVMKRSWPWLISTEAERIV